MLPDRAQELDDLEALIEVAEDELAALRRRRQRNGGPPSNPSDPFDPGGCLEIWLGALHGRRAELFRLLH
jgi:hypothetical protein